MTNAEKIIKIANENNGYVTTKQVKDANINTIELTRLVKQNKLERITRGYYSITNSFCDDYYKYYRCLYHPHRLKQDTLYKEIPIHSIDIL